MNETIIELYKKCYSVSEVLRTLNVDEKKYSRQNIVTILTNAGVYEGINGENYLRVHRNRVNKVIKEKYGVENYGTISRGFGASNKIPYRRTVEVLTSRNTKKIEKPAFCEYTGIKFCDSKDHRSNPNDPRKRSIDHKIPIITGFLMGINPIEIASPNNLAFVLRYVNTVKANTDYDSFLPLAKKIREVFINEGFESN